MTWERRVEALRRAEFAHGHTQCARVARFVAIPKLKFLAGSTDCGAAHALQYFKMGREA